jgi:hypothetical protein
VLRTASGVVRHSFCLGVHTQHPSARSGPTAPATRPMTPGKATPATPVSAGGGWRPDGHLGPTERCELRGKCGRVVAANTSQRLHPPPHGLDPGRLPLPSPPLVAGYGQPSLRSGCSQEDRRG